jgi:hypothetical protein|tara:strand:+ start:4533 stop:5270 length:738 start_codon:yes stop_codon:yes gene_type:complete
MSSNIIESLRDDSKYYGDFGKKYLSNSDIYSLLNNPKNFRISQKGLPLLKGGYFHTAMLEPQKIGDYPVIDASTRSTKAFKEHILENNLDPYDVLLSKEVDEITTWVNAMKSNFVMYSDIYAQGNIYEQPAIATIFGIEWKGKADIVTADKVIDIKTTGNIDKFKWSANDYNYDSQAYIYEQLFGKPVEFYIIDKTTLKLKIAKPSEETLLRGRNKVLRAIEIYNKFFAEGSVEDVTQYIEYEQF